VTTTVLAYIPSPTQGVWYLGPVPIRAYALFIIVGIVVALVIGDRRWEARGGERGVIYDIALWAVPFGLIGGRLYHVITDWPKYFGDGGAGLFGALRIWDGGLGIWGAVALGGVGAWIGCRSRGIPLPAFGDAIAPGIVLAQAIGRLGNYFNQELYGRPTDLPWGLEIYERENASGVVSPDLANGVSTGQLDSIVHPTFLYELLWNVLVFAVLIWVDRRFKVGHGRLFALYVAGYCMGRFWIELLRSDQASLIADIRVNSFTSTFVFIGAVVYIMVAPKGREDPETLKGKPREESLVDEVADELVAVAATSGVVAAAKAAGDDEDEDARAADMDASPEVYEHTDVELEELEPDDDSVELKAAVATSSVGANETEVDADESETDSDAEAEAAEGVGGVGAVEGADAVEAQEAAPEVHEAALEGATGAEELAEEVAAESEAEIDGGAEESEATQAEESSAIDDESDAVGGVGAVEGEDAVDAQEAAPEVRETALEDAAEAEELGDEVAEEVAAEPDAENPAAAEAGAEAFGFETPEPAESDSIRAGIEVEEADVAAEQPPAAVPAVPPEPAQESVGRLRRLFHRRRG
jgi:prolipoprotein diacylglyceryl transferase